MRPMSDAAARAFAPVVAGLFVAMALSGCSGSAQAGVLRLGYIPNLTHAQPLYGVQSGLYQRAMGDVQLKTTSFNAGPAAFEALLSGNVDVIYVGPGPTLNALDHAGSAVVRIVAGSALGGASFVLRPGVSIASAQDLAGKRFATPQLGNTQDIALKHWLLAQGHKTKDQGGGDVDVINAANPDILSLFQSGQVDGAWVPEPWATRLVLEGHGTVHLDEASLWPNGTFITTQVVTTKAFLDAHPMEVGRLLDAHVAATRILQSPTAETNRTINDAISALTGKRLGDSTITDALSHVRFTTDAAKPAMRTLSQWSHELGFSTGPPPDLDAAYDLGPLGEALKRAGTA